MKTPCPPAEDQQYGREVSPRILNIWYRRGDYQPKKTLCEQNLVRSSSEPSSTLGSFSITSLRPAGYPLALQLDRWIATPSKVSPVLFNRAELPVSTS